MEPPDGESGQEQPGAEILVFRNGVSETPHSFQGTGGDGHTRASEINRPSEVVPGKLNHPVRRPIADGRSSGKQRGVRVGNVEVGLDCRGAAVEFISHFCQEIGRDSIVGIEHHEGFIGVKRMRLQIPGKSSTLAVRPIGAFRDRSPRSDDRNGVVRTPIGEYPHVVTTGWVVLFLQIREQVLDHCFLVVSRNDDPETAATVTLRCQGRGFPSPRSHEEVVADQSDQKYLRCESDESQHSQRLVVADVAGTTTLGAQWNTLFPPSQSPSSSALAQRS